MNAAWRDPRRPRSPAAPRPPGTTSRSRKRGAAGLFLLIAAVTAHAHQAKGIDATLRAFTKTPAGPWLLVLVALGLVIFGSYSLAEARWRRL